jgi:hypothetical protein
LRCDGSISECCRSHAIRRAPSSGVRDSTAAPAPSPNRQALISTPGSSSRYIAGAADLDADRQHVFGRARRQQRAAELQIRQGGRTSLADQVVGLDVGAQAEALRDVAGKPGHR